MFHYDFEFFLLAAVILSGIIWLVDIQFFQQKRAEKLEDENIHEPIIVEYAKSFFPVLLIVLILRGFVFEPFRIPSGSMMPGLLVGDFILVNKFSYGMRLPVFHTRLTEGDKPKRGDVAVFRYPKNESRDYIKRIIGLPGDEIHYYNRRLIINGEPLQTDFINNYQGLGELNNMPNGTGCDASSASCQVFIEKQGDVEYSVMNDPRTYGGIEGVTSVPAGHYFVMGDNRDHSEDSRFWGFVPEENLVGKAIIVWMHWDWRNQGNGLDISRIGTKISQ